MTPPQMGQNIRIRATFPKKINGLAHKEKLETHQLYEIAHVEDTPQPALCQAHKIFKVEYHRSGRSGRSGVGSEYEGE